MRVGSTPTATAKYTPSWGLRNGTALTARNQYTAGREALREER